MKYYLFRDLQNEYDGDLTYHPAGIVTNLVNPKGCPSGKELAVMFFCPFEGVMIRAWRMYEEVELFEINEYKHGYLLEDYIKVDKL